MAYTRQQSLPWQQGRDHATTFRPWLGTHLAQRSLAARQAIAQGLISTVVVTGEDVDGHCRLPFDAPPPVAQRPRKAPEGALDVHFISSLPVMQRPACTAWADKRHVQIV